jgi:hypothetical protein
LAEEGVHLQGPQADGGAAKLPPQQGIVQTRGWASGRKMRSRSLRLPLRGRPERGPVGQPGDAVLVVAVDPDPQPPDQ